MAKAKGNTEVAVKDESAQLPAEYGAYEQFAGAGFENHTADDYSIPFINILQALSPQLNDNPELRQGMVLNTVTGEVFAGNEGITFIPATTQHKFTEFKPREAGGGFVGNHEPNSELVQHCKANQSFGDFKTPEGNELIETFYVYGVLIDGNGDSSQVVVAFTSSKIKKYKGWMTKAKTIQIPLPDCRRIPAPLFAHKYRLKTVSEKNAKGQFFNWEIAFDGENAMAARLVPNDPLFQYAVKTKEMVDKGTAKADFKSQDVAGAGETGAGADGKPVF